MTHIAHEVEGSGPPVLLLHGFPQTRAMWHAIAPVLARDFTVVTADLRGYGASAAPGEMADMSFRAMATDQVALMRRLGFDRFHVVGHDRGARTAHRMALDSEGALLSLALLDIVPTHVLLDQLTHETARAYHHWFFLSQPAPQPEEMIAHDPDRFFERTLMGLGGMGSPRKRLPHTARRGATLRLSPRCVTTTAPRSISTPRRTVPIWGGRSMYRPSSFTGRTASWPGISTYLPHGAHG